MEQHKVQKIKLMTVKEMEESGEYSENLIDYLKEADIKEVQYGARLGDGIKEKYKK